MSEQELKAFKMYGKVPAKNLLTKMQKVSRNGRVVRVVSGDRRQSTGQDRCDCDCAVVVDDDGCALSCEARADPFTQERKYFDSGDYMMSKAGVSPPQPLGTAIPTPEG